MLSKERHLCGATLLQEDDVEMTTEGFRSRLHIDNRAPYSDVSFTNHKKGKI